MKKTLIYSAALVVTTLLLSSNYASARNNNGSVTHIDGNVQFPHSRWQIVRHTFRIHVPKNSKALTELIINIPDNITLSNDIKNIDVVDEKEQRINTNVSVNGRTILLAFSEAVAPNTKFYIDLKNVKKPTISRNSIYHLSVKIVGSDAEIPIGVAQFHTY
ncbi:MAG: DUF2808 domain-containing protein [Hassallia sp.]